MNVTTIIATYNRKDDLCRCIEAVLARTVFLITTYYSR